MSSASRLGGDKEQMTGSDGSPTLQHVVLFGFPKDLEPSEHDEFGQLIRTIGAEVASVENLRLGRDLHLVGDRTRGYQYLMVMEFSGVEPFLAYRAHAAHVALSKFIRARKCEVVAFDYFLDDEACVSAARVRSSSAKRVG